MTRMRTGTRSAVAALLAAAATVTTAQSARADHLLYYCNPTAPTYVVGASPYGATWISNGVLIDSIRQQEGWLVNCLYEGDMYQYAAGTTTLVGRGQFYDPRQIERIGGVRPY